MMFKAIVATGVLVLGVAPYAAAQALATPVSAPEPLAGLLVGLGLLGVRFLRRH